MDRRKLLDLFKLKTDGQLIISEGLAWPTKTISRLAGAFLHNLREPDVQARRTHNRRNSQDGAGRGHLRQSPAFVRRHLHQEPHQTHDRFVLHYGDVANATNLIASFRRRQPTEDLRSGGTEGLRHVSLTAVRSAHLPPAKLRRQTCRDGTCFGSNSKLRCHRSPTTIDGPG